MVVAEDALTGGIYQFLVADGQKFPLPNSADALYLLRRNVNVLVGFEADFCLSYAMYQQPNGNDADDDTGCYQYQFGLLYLVEVIVHVSY